MREHKEPSYRVVVERLVQMRTVYDASGFVFIERRMAVFPCDVYTPDIDTRIPPQSLAAPRSSAQQQQMVILR